MKKTLITLLALAGVAAAANTQFLDLSESDSVGNLAYDVTTGKITTTVAGDLYQSSQSTAQTNIIITMNLTAAKAVTVNTKIVELDYNGDSNVALLATTTGLVGVLDDADSPVNSDTYTWDSLAANSNVFIGKNGNEYITLMISQWQNGSSGFVVNTSNGCLINKSGLGDKSFNSMNALYVNNSYVAGLEVSPNWIGSDDLRQTATATFNNDMKQKLIPEPATATLSLLALCGLCARRRRK